MNKYILCRILREVKYFVIVHAHKRLNSLTNES